VTGFLQFDGVDQPGVENDAFGVDILFTPGTASPDWDLVATSSSGGAASAQIAISAISPGLNSQYPFWYDQIEDELYHLDTNGEWISVTTYHVLFGCQGNCQSGEFLETNGVQGSLTNGLNTGDKIRLVTGSWAKSDNDVGVIDFYENGAAAFALAVAASFAGTAGFPANSVIQAGSMIAAQWNGGPPGTDNLVLNVTYKKIFEP
jgi:hypothetical protein